MAYKLEIPEDLTVTHPSTNKEFPITFKHWALEILDDTKMGTTARDLLMRERMEEKIGGAESELTLTNDEYEKLKDIVESPTGGYQTKVAKQMLPFIKAVLSAEKTD